MSEPENLLPVINDSLVGVTDEGLLNSRQFELLGYLQAEVAVTIQNDT